VSYSTPRVPEEDLVPRKIWIDEEMEKEIEA
jgi:hypothetical protein